MRVTHLRALGLGVCVVCGLAGATAPALAASANDPAAPVVPAAVASTPGKAAGAEGQTASRRSTSDPVIVYLDPKSKKQSSALEDVDVAATTGGRHKAQSLLRASRYAALISKYAKAHGVPLTLAHAVVRIESNFNPRARGSAGEIGLMQIKPATARAIGFSGSAGDLYDPATNLQWGMKYLGDAHRLAGGDTCGTILRYNGGHFARRMNPVSARYCRRVQVMLRNGEASAYAAI